MLAQTFERNVMLPVSPDEAFAWHERPGAVQRLLPPWEHIRVARASQGIQDGSRVEFVHRLGPLPLRWIAEHRDYRPGYSFRDIQLHGPFTRWEHLHQFESQGPGQTRLTDHVQFQLPGGAIGSRLGRTLVDNLLRRMFHFRHRRTVADLTAHSKFRKRNTMHIAISGSRGLVGSELVPFLTTGGHRVTHITRTQSDPNDVVWNPQQGQLDAADLEGIDAAVHLAGENIAGRRWNTQQKQRILDSRVNGTRLLCEKLAALQTPPQVLISASAIGLYGDRGSEIMSETSESGEGFLPDVAEQWEAATQPAKDAGIRVVHLRFGVILSPRGGALAKMLTPFRLGGGGVVGNGKQYWSWISLDDAVSAILHALMTDSLKGPVNVVAPQPVTNLEFTKTLGRVLARPTIVPMPGFLARLVLGEMANDLLLSSLRVAPQRLLETGFTFQHAELETALRHLLGRSA